MPEPDCGTTETRCLYPADKAERIATITKALSDPARLRLLQFVAATKSGTVCACHLPEELGITQPTMSFHMKKLYEAGLVDREKRGRWMHYTARPEALSELQDFLTFTTPKCHPEASCATN